AEPAGADGGRRHDPRYGGHSAITTGGRGGLHHGATKKPAAGVGRRRVLWRRGCRAPARSVADGNDLEREVASIQTRASRIKLLLFDVDGVLTDGKILLHPDGTESKRFDIKDGTGLVWAQRAGLKVGLLSARRSASTAQRAAQLGVTIVHQGVPSKIHAYDDILRQQQLSDGE